MIQLNTYTQVKSPDTMIQLRSNDNAVEVKGQIAEGYLNKSIMLDDPELATKLTNQVDAMKQHQRQQLVDFCGEQAPALEEFDMKMADLEEKLAGFLEELN